MCEVRVVLGTGRRVDGRVERDMFVWGWLRIGGHM